MCVCVYLMGCALSIYLNKIVMCKNQHKTKVNFTFLKRLSWKIVLYKLLAKCLSLQPIGFRGWRLSSSDSDTWYISRLHFKPYSMIFSYINVLTVLIHSNSLPCS